MQLECHVFIIQPLEAIIMRNVMETAKCQVAIQPDIKTTWKEEMKYALQNGECKWKQASHALESRNWEYFEGWVDKTQNFNKKQLIYYGEHLHTNFTKSSFDLCKFNVKKSCSSPT